MDAMTGSVEHFESYNGGWSPQAIYHAAEHAAAVYLGDDAYADLVVNAGWHHGYILPVGHVQFAMAWSGSDVVIAFQGSKDLGDWIDDLKSVVRVRWPEVLPDGAKVSLGALCQTKSIIDMVSGRLAEKSFRVHLVGHSLGAQIAVLVAAYLASINAPVSFVTCFGSPRTGNKAWAKHYASLGIPTRLIVNTSGGLADIVSRLPKKSWGWRHVGDMDMICETGVYHGIDAWEAHRKANPITSPYAAYRIVSKMLGRLRRGVNAHRVEKSILPGLAKILEPAKYLPKRPLISDIEISQIKMAGKMSSIAGLVECIGSTRIAEQCLWMTIVFNGQVIEIESRDDGRYYWRLVDISGWWQDHGPLDMTLERIRGISMME
jgi:hypothetical protein